MRLVKIFLIALGYALMFCVLEIIFMMIVGSFITEGKLLSLGALLGIVDADGILDLYIDITFLISTIPAVGIMFLTHRYLKQKF